MILCQVCGEQHSTQGSVSNQHWIEAEQARLSAAQLQFPSHTLAPLRAGREYVFDPYYRGMERGSRGQRLWLTWAEYYQWLQHHACEVHPKASLFVANPSQHPSLRRDHNQLWIDRIYLDSDEAGSWDHFRSFCAYYGIPAIFHESAGSVRDRTRDGDWNGPPRAWHAEMPLARRFVNPWSTGSANAPVDPRWSFFKDEIKRAIRHTFAVLSAFAFRGVGGKCGFDLAPTGLCVPRFLGTRAEPEGPAPYLEMVPGNNAIDWEALLYATGFQWRPYVPPQPQQARTVRTVTVDGTIKEKTIASFDRSLYSDVKLAVSVTRFLEGMLHETPTARGSGGTYYFCPAHNERSNPSGLSAGPNRKGFHVFRSPEGEERWRCHGDCSAGGDVIHLAAAVWGLSVGKAAWRLAQEAGLDTSKYLTQAAPAPGHEPPAEEEQPSEEFDGQEDETTRPRRQTKAKVYSHVADWIESWLLDAKKPGSSVRALARVLVEGKYEVPTGEQQQGTKKPKKRMVSVRRDPDEIAATVYSVLYDQLHIAQAEGEVYDVIDRLQQGKPCSGRPWLRDQLGYLALYELAVAMWKDDLVRQDADPFPVYLKKTLSFDRLLQKKPGRPAPAGRKYLFALRQWVETNIPIPAEEKDRKDYASLLKQIERPCGCYAFYQEVTTSYGRELGTRHMLCKARGCTGCQMTEMVNEWDFLLPEWQKIGGPFHIAKLTLSRLDQVAELKKYVSKAGRASLCVLGFDEELPVVTYVTTNGVDMAYVAGRMEGFRGREIFVRRNKEMLRLAPMEQCKLQSPEEALGVVMAMKASYHTRLRDLIWRGAQATIHQTPETDPREEILEFLRWSHRRQVVVSRSKRGLPWATKEQLKKAAAEDERFDLMDGEVATYTLFHTATKYKLGVRQGTPFTIDQATGLAKRSSGLKQAIALQYAEAQQPKNPQARARAPVV